MTAQPEGTERALALGLAVAIARAMQPGAGVKAIGAARDAASVLGLDSLDALLHQFEPHLGGTWPVELEPVRDRLLRTAVRCREEERLEPFRAATSEWAALAAELAAIEWTETPAPGPGVATLALSQALDDVPFEPEDAAVHRVRLVAAVAASLRAALDWLSGSAGFLRPLRVRAEESLLEVSCEGLDPMGLEAAQRVIAAVDGSLGPNPRAGEGGWTLRVPAAQVRDHFLMLEQGRLRLAIPWHSVLRLQAVPAVELESRARALGYPLLEPLAPLATSPPERPVVTVAHGLRRGWVIADRVIWRLAAEPCAADAVASASGLEQAVRTEDGEVFAVATARRLLGSTPIPDTPLGTTLESESVEPLEEPGSRIVEAATLPAAPAASPVEPEPEPEPEPHTLEAADVTPLPAEEPAAPAPVAETGRGAEEDPELGLELEVGDEGEFAPEVLTALVVDDAFASQAFLARTLEGRGFDVVLAGRARELDAVIETRSWSLVLLDVDLPDASGAAFLRSALARLGQQNPPPAVVALVRDRHDADVANAAGLHDMLEKPVDEGALVKLLERLAASHRLPA